MPSEKRTRLGNDLATLEAVVSRIAEVASSNSKGGLFPHGITFIRAAVNVSTFSLEVQIQGPDRDAGRNALAEPGARPG